jgi:hypothetical protein
MMTTTSSISLTVLIAVLKGVFSGTRNRPKRILLIFLADQLFYGLFPGVISRGIRRLVIPGTSGLE